MGVSERVEHLLVDRVTPLLLIVLIPVMGTVYVLDRMNDHERRDQLIAACERGNAIRENQRLTFAYLQRTAASLAEQAATPADRAEYERAIEDLRLRGGQIRLVNCQEIH